MPAVLIRLKVERTSENRIMVNDRDSIDGAHPSGNDPLGTECFERRARLGRDRRREFSALDPDRVHIAVAAMREIASHDSG